LARDSLLKLRNFEDSMAPSCSRMAKSKSHKGSAVLQMNSTTKISKLVSHSDTGNTLLAMVVPAALVAVEAARYIQPTCSPRRITKGLANQQWLECVNNLGDDIRKLPPTSFTHDSRRKVRSFQIGGTQSQNAHSGSPLVAPRRNAATRKAIDRLWTPDHCRLRTISATMARVAKIYMSDGAEVNEKHIAKNKGRRLCASKVFQRLQVTIGAAVAHKDHKDIHNGCCITMAMHGVDATSNKPKGSQLHIWDESNTRHKLRMQTGDMIIFRSKQVKHCVRTDTGRSSKNRCSIVGYTNKRVSPLNFRA
jgi:hypothetical protein